MPRRSDNNVRILAIDPSPRGFGFAVFEGPERLLDWGVAELYSDNPRELLVRVEALVERYSVRCLVVEDLPEDPRRDGSRGDVDAIAVYARSRRVAVRKVSRATVRLAFGHPRVGRHEIATQLVNRFPELGPRLPRKRSVWSSDDERMNIFDAVALALVAFADAEL